MSTFRSGQAPVKCRHAEYRHSDYRVCAAWCQRSFLNYGVRGFRSRAMTEDLRLMLIPKLL